MAEGSFCREALGLGLSQGILQPVHLPQAACMLVHISHRPCTTKTGQERSRLVTYVLILVIHWTSWLSLTILWLLA